MKKESLNFIDLFSGCGGFSCGLELAGHKCLLAVDIDKNAIETFSANHQYAKTLHLPIEQLDKDSLLNYLNNKPIDLVVGGPPCQGFSTVGRGVASDKRNKLFIHFVKIVSWLQPKVIILENVTGLLAQKNAQILKNIFKQFESLGYSMSARILNSEVYGAPTQRRRTFIVGAIGVDPESVFPSGSSQRVTVGFAWKSSMKDKNGKISNHDLEKTKISNNLDYKRLKSIPEGKSIRYKEDEDAYFSHKLKLNIDWDKLPENRLRQKKYYRLDRQKVAPTIMTSSRTYFHPIENRYLSIREVAALQGFPADFIFKGSYTSMYRQIGNAVVPIVSKAFGEKLSTLKFTNKNKKMSRKINLNALRASAFRYQEELT
jgi:DNA (cytosine-5)-methyltransferase 1